MRINTFLSATLLSLGIAASAPAADWNQWRGPNRDGAAPKSPPLIESLPPGGLKPVWLSEAEIPSARGGGWSSPVVVGDRVYAFAHRRVKATEKDLPPRKYPWLPPDKRGHLTPEQYEEYEVKRRLEDQQRSKHYHFDEAIYCIDTTNGKTIWENNRRSVYTRFPHSGTPAVVAGRLYVLGAGRVARCVDATTGKDLWSTRLPDEFVDEHLHSSFAIADGAAVVLAGRLYGLDAASGKILWAGDPRSTRGDVSSPVVWRSGTGERIVANVSGGDTVCVEPRTGKELWRIETGAGRSTPIIVGDKLITYGGSRRGGLRCYDLSGAEPKRDWTYNGAADSGSSPVVVGDYA